MMPMDLPDFEDGLDRFGADLATWPAALRSPASALIESSAAARATQADLREIEDLLRRDRPTSLDTGVVASRAMRHRQDRPVRRAVRRTGWAAAAVIALILGLFVGGIGPDREDAPDHAITTAFEQLAPIDVD